MRADECKCKFHAGVATSLLGFVLLNYIAFLLHFVFNSALDCYQIKSPQKNEVIKKLCLSLLASFAGGIIHTAKLNISGWRSRQLGLRDSSCNFHRTGLGRLLRSTLHTRAACATA